MISSNASSIGLDLLPNGPLERALDSSPSSSESFCGLLLRHRGRTGLTQRELTARLGAGRRTVQDWEAGVNHPSAERLQALIRVLLEAGGLSAGREAEEAHALWATVEREAARLHAPFDSGWFALLLAEHATPAAAPEPARASIPAVPVGSPDQPGAAERRQDWGEAPDITGFLGRIDELALLRSWVLEEHCRLLAVLGMGGIGKTSLAARLAQEVAPDFERVYWRSLRDAPPMSEWLTGAIGFLSDQRLVPPAGDSERLATLLRVLRERRCLLVLDNSETLFEPGQLEGRYRAGMAAYGRLLQAVGEASHQSCLVLTSREAPPELAPLAGDQAPVRALELGGLGVEAGRALLHDKGLSGDAAAWARLVERYGGNALALKIVGEGIRQLFGGDIAAGLEYVTATYSIKFGGIRRLLAERVERSSALEQSVPRVLAVEREPVSITQLIADIGSRLRRGAVLDATEALLRRSLVERAEAAETRGHAAFTLQSVVLEYLTDRLVEDVSGEIAREDPGILLRQPLIKAVAKDYVRASQERLIGWPGISLIFEQQSDGVGLVLGVPFRYRIGHVLRHPERHPYLPEGRVCLWGGWGGSRVTMDVDRRVTFAYMPNKMGPDVGDFRRETYVRAVYAGSEQLRSS